MYGNSRPWNYICDVFNYLPYAALIDGKIFCVHSGISQNFTVLNQLQILDRFEEIPTNEGVFYDLVWSSPDESITDWGIGMNGANTFG